MVYLNLAELLEKNNRSKYWLVKKLDSNYTVINNMIEHKTSAISFKTFARLLEIFECTPNDLFKVE